MKNGFSLGVGLNVEEEKCKQSKGITGSGHANERGAPSGVVAAKQTHITPRKTPAYSPDKPPLKIPGTGTHGISLVVVSDTEPRV